MNIIIAGCGIVGTALTERLASDKHNVTVIDNDQEHLSYVESNFDVLTIDGDATSPDILKQAKVAYSDLLIAVTGFDEMNLIMCLVAKKLGVKNTIARIRDVKNAEAASLLKEEAGLSFIINPEQDCAIEIFNSLKFKFTDQVEPLAKGMTEVITCTIKPDTPVAGHRIREIRSVTNVRILCCGIKRSGSVFIPTADTVIEPNDKLSFIASSKDTVMFFKKMNYDMGRIDDISIIGGSRLGVFLARKALEIGIPVKIIDSDKNKCNNLINTLPRAEIILGDGKDTALLEEEEILDASAVVAATNDDSTNILISMYIKKKSAQCKTVTKIKKSDFEDMVYDLEIGSIFNPKYITVDHIARYVGAMQNSLEDEVESVIHVIDNKVAIMEFNVGINHPHLNVPIKDLDFKDDLLIASIGRDRKVFIPTGEDEIHAKDIVIVATTNEKIRRFSDIFA